MGFFDGFPFTNTHQLNLDWILQRIGKVDADSAAAVEAANRATEAANNANGAVSAVNRRVDEAIENSLTAAEQAAASAAAANNVATEIRGIANGATETANNAYNIASGIAATADQAFATAEEALSIVSGDTVYKDWSEVDTLYGNGTYAFNGINQTINGIYVTSAVMRVIAYSNSYCTQILRTVENASGSNRSYTLIRSRGVIGWDGWECPDPPMQGETEYRTTERFYGKPVYCKSFTCGAMPSSGEKSRNHGTMMDDIVRVSARCYFASGDCVSLPMSNTVNVHVINSSSIYLWCESGGGQFVNTEVDVYYTKP